MGRAAAGEVARQGPRRQCRPPRPPPLLATPPLPDASLPPVAPPRCCRCTCSEQCFSCRRELRIETESQSRCVRTMPKVDDCASGACAAVLDARSCQRAGGGNDGPRLGLPPPEACRTLDDARQGRRRFVLGTGGEAGRPTEWQARGEATCDTAGRDACAPAMWRAPAIRMTAGGRGDPPLRSAGRISAAPTDAGGSRAAPTELAQWPAPVRVAPLPALRSARAAPTNY